MHACALRVHVHSLLSEVENDSRIQTRGMSRGTRRSSPADWYLHMELLQSDPRFTAAPRVEGYQMLVLMIMCSAETPSYRRPACNKHLPLACIRAQTDIKTLIAGTLINRNKPRENAQFRPIYSLLFFFILTWHARWDPPRNPLDFFSWIFLVAEQGRSLEAEAVRFVTTGACSWGLPVSGKGEISRVSPTHGHRRWTRCLASWR